MPAERLRITVWLPVTTQQHLSPFMAAIRDLEDTFSRGWSACRYRLDRPVWHGLWADGNGRPIRDSHVLFVVDAPAIPTAVLKAIMRLLLSLGAL